MCAKKKSKKATVKTATTKSTTSMIFSYSNFTLKIIATVMMIIGTIGVSIIQNGVLDLGNLTMDSLLDVLETDVSAIWPITGVFLCKGFMATSLPIYAFLFVEGYKKTSSSKKYALRIGLLALVSEVPYDLAMSNSWFTMSSQNPVWGILIAFILLYYIDYFEKTKKIKGFLLKLLLVLAGTMWAAMLHVSYGSGLVLVVAALWFLEKHRVLKTLFAGVVSMFYFPAPFGLVFNHFCNKKKGMDYRMIFYIIYPAQLLLLGLIGKYLL